MKRTLATLTIALVAALGLSFAGVTAANAGDGKYQGHVICKSGYYWHPVAGGGYCTNGWF